MGAAGENEATFGQGEPRHRMATLPHAVRKPPLDVGKPTSSVRKPTLGLGYVTLAERKLPRGFRPRRKLWSSFRTPRGAVPKAWGGFPKAEVGFPKPRAIGQSPWCNTRGGKALRRGA